MTLTEILTARSNVLLICMECDAHQSAYIPAMIEKHHPDTEFDVAVRRHDCQFCGVKGRFRYIEPISWKTGLN